MQKKKVVWADINLACQYLARKIWLDVEVKNIYGIKPSGFVPALLVSRYSHKEFCKEFPKECQNDIVVIDSMIDDGKIYKQFKNGVKFASLYVREDFNYISDLYYFYRKVPKNIWLVFAWEKEYENNYEWFDGNL